VLCVYLRIVRHANNAYHFQGVHRAKSVLMECRNGARRVGGGPPIPNF
jgi:hypothetical protein